MLDGIGSIMLTADILLVFTLVHMVLGLQNLRHDTLGDYNITLDVVVYSYVTMVVTWSPPELTLRHTKFLTADVANVPCPNLVAPGKCVFYHRDRPIWKSYEIEGNYLFSLIDHRRECVYNKIVYTRNAVKPPPVNDVNVNVTTISALVSWTPPIRMREFQYKCIVHDMESNKEYTFYGNSTGLSVNQLHPNKNYTSTIFAKPMPDGNWSDNKTTVFKTLEDRPWAPPIVVQGAYKVTTTANLRTKIGVFFGEVPNQYQCGKITEYRGTVNGQEVFVTDSQTTYAEFEMDPTKDIDLEVSAKTIKGYNNASNISVMHISNADNQLQIRGHTFVSYSQSQETFEVLFQLHVTNKTHLGQQHTVFLCGYKKCFLDKPYEATSIRNGWYHAVLAKPPDVEMHDVYVGITTRVGSIYSGMTMSTCIQDNSASLNAPAIKVGDNQTPETLIIEWEDIPCSKRGSAFSYVIYECLSDHCNSTTNSYEVFLNDTQLRLSEVDSGTYSVWAAAKSLDDRLVVSTTKLLAYVKKKKNTSLVGLTVMLVIVIMFLVVIALPQISGLICHARKQLEVELDIRNVPEADVTNQHGYNNNHPNNFQGPLVNDASSAAETSFTRNNNPVMYQDDIVVPLLTGDIHNLDIDSNSEASSSYPSSAAETSFTRNNNPVMYQDGIVVPLLPGDIHNLDSDSNSEASSSYNEECSTTDDD